MYPPAARVGPQDATRLPAECRPALGGKSAEPLIRAGPNSETEPRPELILASPAVDFGKFLVKAIVAPCFIATIITGLRRCPMCALVQVGRQTAPMLVRLRGNLNYCRARRVYPSLAGHNRRRSACDLAGNSCDLRWLPAIYFPKSPPSLGARTVAGAGGKDRWMISRRRLLGATCVAGTWLAMANGTALSATKDMLDDARAGTSWWVAGVPRNWPDGTAHT